MRVNTPFVIVVLLVVSVLGSAHAAGPELSKNVRVYRANEGIRVAVAQVLPKEEAKAALRIGGTDSPLDDVVFLATVEDQGERGSTFKITWRGRSWSILTSRQAWWGWKQLELYLPEQPSVELFYDETESKKVSRASLASGLERDKAKVAALAAFDRGAEQKKHERLLLKASNEAKAACGAELPMSIDWQSIDDATLKAHAIAHFCSAPLESLVKICKDAPRAAAARKKIRKASCSFGPSLKLRVEEGLLTWQTSQDARNQGDFASANLLNLLQ